MIRDKDRIYAEVNDPNTVLANGLLTNGQLVVGTGNKGVQTYTGSNKSLLYQDSSGNVNSLSYNQANKLVGTDADGNLTLVDGSGQSGGHKYLHSIQTSGSAAIRFQFISSDSEPYTTSAQVGTALYNAGYKTNDSGVYEMCPAIGRHSSIKGSITNYGYLVVGIQGVSNGNITIARLDFDATDGFVVASGITTSLGSSIYDIVTEL